MTDARRDLAAASRNEAFNVSGRIAPERSQSQEAKVVASLADAQRQQQRIRARVSAPLVLFGAVIFAVGLLTGFGRCLGLVPPRFGPDGFYFAAGLPGTYLMMLAVRPTDTFRLTVCGFKLPPLVRLVHIVVAIYAMCGGLLSSFIVVVAAAGSNGIREQAPRDCEAASGPARAGCNAFIAGWTVVALSAFGLGVYLSRQYVRIRREVSAHRQQYLPRQTLRVLWGGMRMAYAGFGVGTGGYVVARAIVEPSWFRTLDFYASLTHALWDICLAAALSPPARRRFMALLVALGAGRVADGEAKALVASMSSGVGAAEALRLARRGFRGLPVRRLRRSDLESFEGAAELGKRATPLPLGAIDVYVSHSWEDCAGHKYDALRRFADEFRARSVDSAELLVWLDKACLDVERSADEHIAMLPVLLGGCRELLILAGPTFGRRLWCALELFVFLRAGGSIDNVHVVPIAAPGEQLGASDCGQRRRLHQAALAQARPCTAPLLGPFSFSLSSLPPSLQKIKNIHFCITFA